MTYFLRGMTLLLTLALCVPTMAEPQRYKVELIAFSHSNAAGLNSENWPIITNPGIDSSGAITLKPLLDDRSVSGSHIASYYLLDNSNFTLNRVANTLSKTPGYNVMLHIAWYQPISESRSSGWIHVFGGTGYSEEGRAIAENTDGNASYNQAAHWQVDGLLHLNRLRYINSSYHFAFAAPIRQIQELSTTRNFAKIDAPLVYFKLNESRRMRSDELNYISHPLYGILINITQVGSSHHTQE